jgi:LEA14-like dessication related protein
MRFLLPRLLFVAVTALFLTAGCASNTQIRGIAVQLIEVKVAPVAGGGADLTASIRYINENLVAIASAGSRHRLSLNGVSVGRLESEQPIGLPQMGTDVQDITVRVDGAMLARLQEMQSAGVANYQLESTIRVLAGDDKLESRTSASGSVPVR